MGDVVPYLCHVEGIRAVGWGPTIHNTLAWLRVLANALKVLLA
jgi:hypothetical protein